MDNYNEFVNGFVKEFYLFLKDKYKYFSESNKDLEKKLLLKIKSLKPIWDDEIVNLSKKNFCSIEFKFFNKKFFINAYKFFENNSESEVDIEDLREDGSSIFYFISDNSLNQFNNIIVDKDKNIITANRKDYTIDFWQDYSKEGFIELFFYIYKTYFLEKELTSFSKTFKLDLEIITKPFTGYPSNWWYMDIAFKSKEMKFLLMLNPGRGNYLQTRELIEQFLFTIIYFENGTCPVSIEDYDDEISSISRESHGDFYYRLQDSLDKPIFIFEINKKIGVPDLEIKFIETDKTKNFIKSDKFEINTNLKDIENLLISKNFRGSHFEIRDNLLACGKKGNFGVRKEVKPKISSEDRRAIDLAWFNKNGDVEVAFEITHSTSPINDLIKMIDLNPKICVLYLKEHKDLVKITSIFQRSEVIKKLQQDIILVHNENTRTFEKGILK